MNETMITALGTLDRERELGELEQHVQEAIGRALELGADQVEANASLQAGFDVNVRMGEVETIEHTRDRGVSVTVYLGRRKGHASSADLQPGSVGECVRRAVEIARFTQEDRCNGLADPERLATEIADLDLWHPRPLDVEEAIGRALECEAAGRADPRITNSEGAAFSSHSGLAVYGNSHGFTGRSSGTRYGQNCVLIAGHGEHMQRDYWWDSRRRFGELESPVETGRIAAERTVGRLGARQVPTAKAPVLLSPEVARGLLGHFVSAISGGALYRNASFLKDTLGQQLFPEWMTIAEHPLLPGASGSAAFDAEGVATRQRNIVEAGVLQGYVLSSYSARRLGLETTGNAGGVHNLSPSGKLLPAGELLGALGTGLLVNEVMGQGVSIVTGDYSRGATGYWVEDGRIAHPVEEVTIAGNLRSMFANIRALGDDLDERSNIRTGSILVAEMTIAGS